MISSGNTTVCVSNMDAAVRFYADTLGLNLTNRIGNRWATIEAGPSYWTTDDVGAGLVLALRGPSPEHPTAGTRGAVTFGLETYHPLESLMARLQPRGVRFTSEIIRFEAGNSVGLEDPDGNPMYIHEFPPEMLEEEDRGRAGDESSPTLSSGHATVFVSNMDTSVKFYRDVLGLKLTNRFDNHWATLEAGRKLVVGLHPESPRHPKPGTKGATMLGLEVDEPIERVVSRLAAMGVKLQGGIVRSEQRSSVQILDIDGNVIELNEAETGADAREEVTVGVRRSAD
jgi:catechol 2,3-dioxygenase-like lactoylglutathione lyase family enzyme